MTKHTTVSCHSSKFKPIKSARAGNTLQINEIIGIIPAATVPQQFEAAEGMGAINFHGKILPIVDLRMNLAFVTDDCDEQICILIIEDNDSAETFMLAALVDSELEAYRLVMETTH